MQTKPKYGTLKNFFSGKPSQLELFRITERFIKTLGPVEIIIGTSQIAFKNKRQFAWIWIPMPWDKKRPPGSIVVSFSLGRRVDDIRIVQAVEPYPGRWMHHVIVQRKTDFDREIQGWLREAFVFGASSNPTQSDDDS